MRQVLLVDSKAEKTSGVARIQTSQTSYVYGAIEDVNLLRKIIVACIPNGFLQNAYNPSAQNTIWVSGPNAPTRGEVFRTRLNFGSSICVGRLMTAFARLRAGSTYCSDFSMPI